MEGKKWHQFHLVILQVLHHPTFSVPRLFSLGRFNLTWRSTRIFCQYLCSWSPVKLWIKGSPFLSSGNMQAAHAHPPNIPAGIIKGKLRYLHLVFRNNPGGESHLRGSPASSCAPSAALSGRHSPPWLPLANGSGHNPQRPPLECQHMPLVTVWPGSPAGTMGRKRTCLNVNKAEQALRPWGFGKTTGKSVLCCVHILRNVEKCTSLCINYILCSHRGKKIQNKTKQSQSNS